MAKTKATIVYGATGFTGKKIAIQLAIKKQKFTIAGRSAQKLAELQDLLKEMTGEQVEMLQVDLNGLNDALKPFKLLINCVGPFRFYGEEVVKACISQKVNYVDICGETEFIELVYAKYGEAAVKAGVSIVLGCGYDSIPADLGNLYAKMQFDKEGSLCTQSEMFVSFNSGPAGVGINATTFIAAVHSFSNASNLRQIRAKSQKKITYPTSNKLVLHKGIKWVDHVKAYTLPAMVADVPVVKLSQQINVLHQQQYAFGSKFPNSYKPSKLSPVQFAGYFVFTTYLALIYVSYLGLLLSLTTKFKFIQDMVINYPGIFTFGVFTTSGPSELQLSQSSFSTKFVAKGYKHGLVEDTVNREIIVRVSGPEMGYVSTPVCVITSGNMILNYSDKIPYGVLTPAVAFGMVMEDLILELSHGGIEFRVESRKDI